MSTPSVSLKASQSDSILSEGKILIVDDEPLIIKSLGLTLSRQGYNVLTAQNGKEALQIVQNQPIALLICDLILPGISGTEVLQKAEEISPDTVRVALTGNSNLEAVLKAINVGHVAQFIMKPWDEDVLLQLVSGTLEKYRLVKENQRLQSLIMSQHKELEKNHAHLRYELQLGARIHEELLLGKVPKHIKSIAIEATTVPSSEIDGDFFDFYNPTSYLFDVVLGDVMGKGIPAALVGIALKSDLQRFASPFVHAKYCEKGELWQEDLLPPKEIVRYVHNEISRQLMQLEYFVTLFYGRFNLLKKTFTFVDCGSTKPIHYSFKKKKIQLLSGNNIPIGIVEEHPYDESEIQWDEDDLFIFYSDGITECKSPTKELYGIDRLKVFIEENHQLEPKALLEKIKKTIIEFTHKDIFEDDLTLIILKMKDVDKNLFSHLLRGKFASDLSQMPALRDFVLRLCQNAPGDWHKLSNHLQLAINEAFCNIVKHSYKEEKGKAILVQGELSDDGLLIDICDQGKEFDPSKIADPSLSGDQESGYGLYIMRQIADQIVYLKKASEDGWNRLRIFKRYYTQEVEMEFTHQTIGEILIVTPKMESLDAREARAFKEKVIDLITNNDMKNVVINLEQLQFIDSSGLGSFLAILKNLHSQGGDLKLSHMNKPIRTIFELVSMHKIFEIFNSTEDAVSSFKR